MADIEFDRIIHYAIFTRKSITQVEYLIEDKTDGIAQNSMTLTEMLIDDEFSLGQVNSTMFEVTLFGIRQDLKGKEIKLWATDSENHRTEVFSGVIDNCVLDKYGDSVKITAYDYLGIYGEFDVSAEIKQACQTFIDNPSLIVDTTYGGFISSIALLISQKFKIPIWSNFTSKFASASIQMTFEMIAYIKKYCPKSITFREFLRQLGESECGFIRFDRSGWLDFIPLTQIINNLDSLSAHDKTNIYERNNAEFEQKKYQPPAKVVIFDMLGKAVSEYSVKTNDVLEPHSIDDFIGTYNISNNLFSSMWHSGSSYSYNSAEIISAFLSLIEFNAAQIPMIVSDLSVNLGDAVYLSDENIICPVFMNILSGSQLVEQTVSAENLVFDSEGFTNPSDTVAYIEDFVGEETNWVNLSESDLASEFKFYASGGYVRYRKIGKMVEIQGYVSPKQEITGNATPHTIFTVPYPPSQTVYTVCQGSTVNHWLLTVNNSGTVSFARYSGGAGYITATTSTQLPFNVVYFID